MRTRSWILITTALSVATPAQAELPQDFERSDSWKLIQRLNKTPDRNFPETALAEKEILQALQTAHVSSRHTERVARYVSPRAPAAQEKSVRKVMDILLSKDRQAEGKQFAKQHAKILCQIGNRFRVRPSDLVGMMNVESRFGTITGDHAVLNVYTAHILHLELLEQKAFAEGAYKEAGAMSRKKNLRRVARRKKFMANNLLTTLRFAKTKNVDPASIKGSYAGAVGMTQFMPSNLWIARDGDGDGLTDLHTAPDALASTAQYLNHHGYAASDDKKRRKAFHAYNRLPAYVDAIDRFAQSFLFLDACTSK